MLPSVPICAIFCRAREGETWSSGEKRRKQKFRELRVSDVWRTLMDPLIEETLTVEGKEIEWDDEPTVRGGRVKTCPHRYPSAGLNDLAKRVVGVICAPEGDPTGEHVSDSIVASTVARCITARSTQCHRAHMRGFSSKG